MSWPRDHAAPSGWNREAPFPRHRSGVLHAELGFGLPRPSQEPRLQEAWIMGVAVIMLNSIITNDSDVQTLIRK